MDHSYHNKIVSFIWSIADDCLRDVFVRGKYRDVILPMFVLRRLDVLLEPSKAEVMKEAEHQRIQQYPEPDELGFEEATGGLPFYNVSPYTLQSLLGNPSQLETNLYHYLDGFSANVQEIISNFQLQHVVRQMAEADVLYITIQKFTSAEINLSPNAVGNLPGLSNLGMGYVFEELIRKFNEDNNEEAGEHFTPREVVDLMTHMVFLPVKGQLPDPIFIYDPACGTGGMLTESEKFVTDPEGEIRADVEVELFGKEINPETYAICKSDILIKGGKPNHIRKGSTLSTDEFQGDTFNFMLSNPPYGKSWASEQRFIKDGKDVIDARFRVALSDHKGAVALRDATPRSSDGQLLFLMEMVSKMKPAHIGSRIASVHNGSSLFTGDAEGGESNIRRHIIENDLLEAIIQLPNNIFYNTGISTYIWLLSNQKQPQRKGKVQLIDASGLYRKLRKNLGNKNCEMSPEHIQEVLGLYMDLKESPISKVFDNCDFGYYKVTVERPLRLCAQVTEERLQSLRFAPSLQEAMGWVFAKYGEQVYQDLRALEKPIREHFKKEESLNDKQLKTLLDAATWHKQRELMQLAHRLRPALGEELYMDFNHFAQQVDQALKTLGKKLSAPEKKQLLQAMSERNEQAAPVVAKRIKLNHQKLQELLTELGIADAALLPQYGYFPEGKEYVQYEADSELRDTENIPVKQDILAYFAEEVRPYAPDAWLQQDKTQIGYEISFNKYFYQHTPLRSLEEVAAEILALEAHTDGLLKKIVGTPNTSMQRYETYKPSGIEWIGEVPGHWEVRKLKYLVNNLNNRRIPLDAVTRGRMHNRVYDYYGATGIIDKVDDFIFDDTTILIAEDGANLLMRNIKLVYIATGRYWVNNHAHILKPKSNTSLTYIAHALEIYDYIPLLSGAAQPKLTKDALQNIELPLPPLSEQQAIASYLDGKTQEIREAIEKKEQLIALLKERKQIEISRAVTKGLNAAASLHPSGIEWIGEVPEHWEVRKLKFYVNSISEQTITLAAGEYYLGMENVESWTGKIIGTLTPSFDSMAKRYLINDILFGKLRPYLAKVAYATTSGGCSGEFLVLRPRTNTEVDSKLLSYTLRSAKFIDIVNGSTYGTKMPRAEWSFIGNQPIPLPPLPEQQAIAQHLDAYCQEIEQAIGGIEKQIASLKEYQQVLISEVVTGKRKVC